MYKLDLFVISLGLMLFYHIYYISILSSQKVKEFWSKQTAIAENAVYKSFHIFVITSELGAFCLLNLSRMGQLLTKAFT